MEAGACPCRRCPPRAPFAPHCPFSLQLQGLASAAAQRSAEAEDTGGVKTGHMLGCVLVSF